MIYAGTFSKSMFPALRTAWLVVPLTRVEHFRQQAALTACSVPVLWQQTLADFMRDGHFWRHLKRMRQHYAERRQWMENALTEQGFSVIPQEGGIQLVMSVDGDDVALVRKANQAGLAVQALSRWRITSEGKGNIAVIYQYQLGGNGATGGVPTADGADSSIKSYFVSSGDSLLPFELFRVYIRSICVPPSPPVYGLF